MRILVWSIASHVSHCFSGYQLSLASFHWTSLVLFLLLPHSMSTFLCAFWILTCSTPVLLDFILNQQHSEWTHFRLNLFGDNIKVHLNVLTPLFGWLISNIFKIYKWIIPKSKELKNRCACVAQLIKCPTRDLSSGLDLRVVISRPALSSMLGMEPNLKKNKKKKNQMNHLTIW